MQNASLDALKELKETGHMILRTSSGLFPPPEQRFIMTTTQQLLWPAEPYINFRWVSWYKNINAIDESKSYLTSDVTVPQE